MVNLLAHKKYIVVARDVISKEKKTTTYVDIKTNFNTYYHCIYYCTYHAKIRIIKLL